MWHSVLGYYNIANTQKLISTEGVDMESMFPPKELGSATCYVSLCPLYLRGKGGLTSVKSKLSTSNPDHSDVIKDGNVLPG